MTIKYTKSGRKIFQTAIKYTNIFQSKVLQNLPKFQIFRFENASSGNPGMEINLIFLFRLTVQARVMDTSCSPQEVHQSKRGKNSLLELKLD
jgi:hypothetical protein